MHRFPAVSVKFKENTKKKVKLVAVVRGTRSNPLLNIEYALMNWH